MSEARSCCKSPPCVVHWGWEVLIHDDRLHSESNGGVGSRGWGSGELGKEGEEYGEEIASSSGTEIGVGSLIIKESSRGTGLSPPL